MGTVHFRALSVVLFPAANIDNDTLLSLFDFLRKIKAGNIKFNNAFPLGMPTPFPLLSANIGTWDISVNTKRIDFLYKNSTNPPVETYKIICDIFHECLTKKINKVGFVVQYQYNNESLPKVNKHFLSSCLVASYQDLVLNSLAYVHKMKHEDSCSEFPCPYDNIQIVKNNNLEQSYICVRDLNTGTLSDMLSTENMDRLVKLSVKSFSEEAIKGLLE